MVIRPSGLTHQGQTPHSPPNNFVLHGHTHLFLYITAWDFSVFFSKFGARYNFGIFFSFGLGLKLHHRKYVIYPFAYCRNTCVSSEVKVKIRLSIVCVVFRRQYPEFHSCKIPIAQRVSVLCTMVPNL